MEDIDNKYNHSEEPWRNHTGVRNSEEPWHKQSSIRMTNSKKASILSNKFYADLNGSENKENNPHQNNGNAYQGVYLSDKANLSMGPEK